MKKIYTLSLLAFLPSLSEVHASTYVCETLDGSPAQSVIVSASEPTLAFQIILKDRDGKEKVKVENLVTETTVSTYKIPRDKCSVKMDKMSESDSFVFDFSCRGLVGYLTFSAQSRSGNYYQQLTAFGNERRIGFLSCRHQ